MYELTERDKDLILEKMKLSFLVISDCDDNIAEKSKQGYAYVDIFNPKGYVQCNCAQGRGNRQENVITCKHCSVRVQPLLVGKKKDELDIKRRQHNKSMSAGYPSSDFKTTTFFYVKKMPDKDCGIIIYNLMLSAKAPYEATQSLELKWKINGIVEIAPGAGSKGYKISRKKEVDEDIFTILNINSNYPKMGPQIIFEDAVNSVDFILKNKKFNKYTAYMDLFNVIDINIPKESFFMMYMYLYAAYPSIELVVKMGMYQFCAHMLKKMAHAPDRIKIKEMADSFSKLLRADATTGTQVFNLPKYVVEDCLLRDVSWEEILAWQDIYELDTEGKLGKEQYLYVTRHPQYLRDGYAYQTLVDAMVYGYTPQECINYLHKQNERVHTPTAWRKTYIRDHMAVVFTDYLRICDLMQITPDRYPMDIDAAHDRVAAAHSAQENKMTDIAINNIANAAEKYIPTTQEYQDSEYLIVLPHSSYDVIQEGQNMRNCVGSYLQRIANRESLVFFIRKKDEPKTSLITAEYRHEQITQLYFKNNRAVTDKALRKLANDYAKNLKSAHFETRKIN